MDNHTLNHKLATGELDDLARILPHVYQFNQAKFQFSIDFGLNSLPTEPGILLIRGARQYGKSTWLEQQLLLTVQNFGPGSAFYLNGDDILEANRFENEIMQLLPAFAKTAPVKRLFIDEITSIDRWEFVLKKLADRGDLRNILLITTGSKATDLRRGSEKLPGRKGKLQRTNYLFTPIAYQEFHRVCYDTLQEQTLLSYLLSGGSPIACNELANQQQLPEYVIELVRNWIDGEFSRAGRSIASLFNIFNVIYRFGGNAVGQAKLAREAGLANNSIAHQYIELLNDLACVIPSYPWDVDRKQLILRRPCKYHVSNLLAVFSYHPSRIRSVKDFLSLTPAEQGMAYEWLVAQECLRRSAIAGEEILAPQAFWQNKEHEIDFVNSREQFIEVKRGKCSPLEFSWFTRQFPQKKLIVINANTFETDFVIGMTLEDFLLGKKLIPSP